MEAFWNTVLDPAFGLAFGLVLLAFIPLVYIIWNTWRDEGEITGEGEDQPLE